MTDQIIGTIVGWISAGIIFWFVLKAILGGK